jgi:hypothetical protein
MSMPYLSFDVAGWDFGTLGLGVEHGQHHRALLGQVEVDHAHTAALARPVRAWDHIPRQGIGGNPVYEFRSYGQKDEMPRGPQDECRRIKRLAGAFPRLHLFTNMSDEFKPLRLRSDLFDLLLEGRRFDHGAHG